MELYNTKTRKIEEFIPYNEKQVTMYTCGPTPSFAVTQFLKVN